jgi:heme/copper-type cytochrome/quinol oxidase subunit 2
VIRVTIHGQNVSPAPGNVEVPLGTTVRLVVTSDHDDELHAHGFEVERTLKAGTPTTLELTATDPGVYEIETHHPPLTLLHLVIR